MKEMVLASNNKNKFTEFSRILSPLGFKVFTMEDKGISCEIEETGKTFDENAALKALELAKLLPECYILADDSGICVDALGGEPGVFSARYAGEGGSSEECIAKLLQNLKGEKNRKAHFACSLALYIPEDKSRHIFEGICEGEIALKKSGKKGFGYDPIFLVNGVSYAEMTDKEKDAISHRGNATDELVKWLTHMNMTD